MGPTACGKTGLAISLVNELPCEIISVDSAMIYRGMDIGTAKPGPEILQVAPHRLINILDPTERYSAGRFLKDATREIENILSDGNVPLLVGGTMMYFRILQQGIADLPEANPDVREDIDQRARELGWPVLHAELAEVDPAAALRIKPEDAQRIQRALEVYMISGETMTGLQRRGERGAPDVSFLKIGLVPSDRNELRERISDRFDAMMAQGFLDEVRQLHARPDLDRDKPSMRCVGYRQFWDYFDGKDDLENAKQKARLATRQLAKRQLTWLKAERELYSVDCFESAIKKNVAGYLARKLGP